MDSSKAGAGGPGDEGNPISHKGKGKKTCYKRLTSAQTAKLEKFIKECPHPDEAQRRHLAAEVGLEPKQIKFWFQNKRTQIKNQHERADNTALRVENDRILSENLLMKEALKNMLCHTCGGPPFPEGEHEHFVQKMKLENAQLKEEHEKVSSFLARYLEKQMSPPELQEALNNPMAYDPALGSSMKQVINDGSASVDRSVRTQLNMDNDLVLPNTFIAGNSLMLEIAATAMDELSRLLRIAEPIWVKSSTPDDKYTLNLESYARLFPRSPHFKGPNVRVEGTRDTGIVSINSMQLVDMFLDPEKWMNLFPTIVTKAETIKVIESGLIGTRSGALQLMSEEMHILSPLVQPREYRFLRYCQQIEDSMWVIADVSFDAVKNTSLSNSWRHPSGCMIQAMPNGCSMVTWAEHVEVDDEVQSHQLFKDLVSGGAAYGAQRWVLELQRMGERFSRFNVERTPNQDSEGGVINSVEGKRSLMNFTQRMVKIFCESLTMRGKLDFPHLTTENNNGVRVSIRKSTEAGQPKGMIVVASTTLWFPLPYLKVFEFFTDDKRRPQWDVLCVGDAASRVAHISNGIHPGNCISILQPFIPTENNALIIQESFTNPAGSYIVYGPTDVATMELVIKGEDSSMLQILPSGFVISADGTSKGAFNNDPNVGTRTEGSLLTLAYQILACSPDGTNLLTTETVAAVNSLLTTTVLKVKGALGSNN
ncbi:hypothetical protein RJT34_14493 [Clitoria ternatea]|uniref:Uncharacterized protein n=1 Tax=Clitoria ternatea TaxID=43366 RepID=A0AAN9JT08_CLITE